ncbi:Gp37-like protein [Eggerthella lenta]|uniref:Gp37-like protein n=1 Tax=Eggerthella lenta TaxID=84112 RepID=UPI0022E041A5|nr:hypothetical protein [Eggerthella lenta]
MIMSMHHVAPDGSLSLVAANVPYANLQWSRSFSAPGSFCALLACPLPVEWPGRYVVTLDGRAEVGVLEKVEASEGSDASSPAISGRFAESWLSRYRFGPGGEAASGANWRQAATSAIGKWRLSDLPRISMGSGTEKPSGSSYKIVGEAGRAASEAVYAACSANGAYPLVTYDRDAAPDRMEARLVDGLDRTRAQSDRPIALLSLAMGDVTKIKYSGDYSTACSSVVAYASPVDEGAAPVVQAVPVDGFDPATQWDQVAVEDVGSLIDSDADPTAAAVYEAGRLRALDHMPALSIDCSVPFRGEWDLGDVVEVEIESMRLSAALRVEAVREVYKPEGSTVEVTVGTKSISKIARAMIGRR